MHVTVTDNSGAPVTDLTAADLVVKEGGKDVARDWRADITAALAKRQQADGGWVNKTDRWMEGNPLLVTGYALMTLGYTKPKK